MIRPWPWEKTTLSSINSTTARIDSTELVIQSSFNPRTANLPTNKKKMNSNQKFGKLINHHKNLQTVQ